MVIAFVHIEQLLVFNFGLFQYMKKFIIDIPSEIFDHLLTHLSQCAREYKVKVEREHRRTKLAQLFSFCDHTGVCCFMNIVYKHGGHIVMTQIL